MQQLSVYTLGSQPRFMGQFIIIHSYSPELTLRFSQEGEQRVNLPYVTISYKLL